ncbi:MAG: hypothetical protein EXR62_14550 [Chloroflexi bacterium]|nr:hypothetical protein [Chloroflexota bacterium]
MGAFSLPLPPSPSNFGRNIPVGHDPTTAPQNEPFIAINPTNPNNLLIGANDYREGDARPGYYVSRDAGQSWQDGLLPGFPPASLLAGGDPVVAYDHSGTAYYAAINFSRSLCNAGGISLSRSADGGSTWDSPAWVVSNTTTTFQDKVWLAADAHESSGGKGQIYLTWVEYQYAGDCNGSILRTTVKFAGSEDKGKSFENSRSLSGAESAYPQATAMTVGPDGEIYVIWAAQNPTSGGSRLVLARSTNGGVSFLPNEIIREINPLPSTLPGSSFRVNSFPALASDPVSGTLYLVWADYAQGDSDIMLLRSPDHGDTWEGPVRVNDDPNGNGKDQFFPAIAVGPDQQVHISWYDRRDDPANYLYGVYATQLDPANLTPSRNGRVSSLLSDPSYQFAGTFIGDYSGIAASSSGVFPAWTDVRPTGYNDLNQDIYTALPVRDYETVISPLTATISLQPGRQETQTLWLQNVGLLTETYTIRIAPFRTIELLELPGHASTPITMGLQTPQNASEGSHISQTVTILPASEGSQLLTASILGVAAFGPPGWVVNRADTTLSPFDPLTGARFAAIQGAFAPSDITLTRDGQRGYVSNRKDGGIWVLDTLRHAYVDQLPTPNNRVAAQLLLSVDESNLYMVLPGYGVGSVHLATGSTTSVPLPGAWSIAQQAGSGYLWVSAGAAAEIHLVDMTGERRVQSRQVGISSLMGIAATLDGRFVYGVSGNGILVEVDQRSLEVRQIPGNLPSGYSLALRPGSDEIYVTSGPTGNIVGIFNRQGQIDTIQVGAGPKFVVFSQDGTWAYTSNSIENSVTKILAPSRTVYNTIEVDRGPHGLAIPSRARIYLPWSGR